MDITKRRSELFNLLGDLPDISMPINANKINEENRSDYILETLLLDLNGEERVPAYFAYPVGKQGPFPVIVFNHSHGGNYHLGKDELIQGNSYLQMPSYAEELTNLGYAVICIDAWGFGERSGRTESELFKEMLWNGQVLWGKMVFDTLRTINYITTRKEVDSNRIGTLGMSMGSVMAWWIAALDTRVKICIDICGMVDFQALVANRALDEHGIYFFVPNLMKHFTTSEINELIAPRRHLCLAGKEDKLVPIDGLHKIDQHLTSVYNHKGAKESWILKIYPGGHRETPGMRREVIAYLSNWL
ncbi:dienelactone hydrolase family protein [Sediminibacillus massiliensis]|uniref:dienelactone hydrolase family protein n=1 Tax=Sediminibacillus massiliensis TaxID=1926277 RepID=UPI000988889E|nr:alpha/beta fold hydrolase [Sediminibacillus massiliensis]